MSNKQLDNPNMMHYSHRIHFNTLFRNKVLCLLSYVKFVNCVSMEMVAPNGTGIEMSNERIKIN